MEHLWPRAIAVGVGAIVAALLLKVAPPLVVLAVFVAGFAVFYVRLTRAMRPATIADAEATGLERAETDPFGILGYPLLLLSRVVEPAIDEVVWGRWRGIDVHAFALSFGAAAIDGAAPARTVFSCAMARIPSPAPAVVVEPQLFATSLAAPDLERIDLGDDPFEEAMRIWSRDEAFARALLVPATREWLRSAEPAWGLEVRGNIALVYGPKAQGPDVTPTLETLRGLLARLPKDEGVPHPPAV